MEKKKVNPYKAAEEARKKKEAEEAAQKAAQESAPVAEEVPAPSEPEVAQSAPEGDSGGFDLAAFEARVKQEQKKKKNKENTSFTLSPSVRAEIAKRSKAVGKTQSLYLDDLLKEVLKLN